MGKHEALMPFAERVFQGSGLNGILSKRSNTYSDNVHYVLPLKEGDGECVVLTVLVQVDPEGWHLDTVMGDASWKSGGRPLYNTLDALAFWGSVERCARELVEWARKR